MDAYLEYSEADHAYYVDGAEKPSVTQILDSAGLISQFCKDDQSRWRGQSVHTLCADDDAGKVDFRRVPIELRGYVQAWRKYRRESGFVPSLIEQRVDGPGYSGRFDRYGFIPGFQLPVILDIKTSKAGTVAGYVKYQLAAYCHAFDPKKLFIRVAVALKPDGSYSCKVYPIDDFYVDKAHWLELVQKFGKGE